MGNEIRSPSSSKNIKIIDKFELKDHLYSPPVHTSAPNRKDHTEEFKGEHEKDHRDVEDRNRHLVDLLGSPNQIKEENYDLEVEEVGKEFSSDLKEPQPSAEYKQIE